MIKPTSISLGSLAVLLICVLTGSLFSDRNQTPANTAANQLPTPNPLLSEKNQANTPSKSSSRALAKRSVTGQNYNLISATTATNNATQARSRQEQFLRQRLLLDESALTREVLPDGTELIHLNGSQSHFSAASINADGSIEVQCHSSYEALQNQGSQPVSPASSPSTIK